MFRKLTESEVETLLRGHKTGVFCKYGTVIPDGCTNVVVDGRTGHYLVPISEFSPSEDGLGWTISKRALLEVGGLPKSEEEELAETLGLPLDCCRDIIYLRSRSRWSESLEADLIAAHLRGDQVDIYTFGVNSETQASLYWTASKLSRKLN